MATLDGQIPSVDTFLFKPWSSFVSAAKLRPVDDMICYSHFPALDDFCLVVCHVCNQVVTPQGILTHYGKTPLVIIKHFTKVHTSVSSPVVTLKKCMFINT
uniref:Ataxin 7 like 1 n=1 Tax=Mola mola TaxID=94237 RepID=A0A3Q4AFU5_MOLML